MEDCYRARISGFGEQAMAFAEDRMVILFRDDVADTAPELAEYSVLLSGCVYSADIACGDRLLLDDSVLAVTAVGDKANLNLKNLGHCVLHFDGKTQAELPGNIHLEASGVPQLSVGMNLCFQKKR